MGLEEELGVFLAWSTAHAGPRGKGEHARASGPSEELSLCPEGSGSCGRLLGRAGSGREL